ncbi:hypothetical protein NDU88_009506 [Pleurodeles waltl]|uniref:Uncharacterized protein n=1 Tax=Pleurodeles waltl TaxID=8319 RepID=A0AAV7QXR0_PLEWA|nr:hypothetical protein NDU88_009506 [Pleurodeles waltl]
MKWAAAASRRGPRCVSTKPGSIVPAIACSLRRLPQRGDLRGPPLPPWRSSSPLLGRGLFPRPRETQYHPQSRFSP